MTDHEPDKDRETRTGHDDPASDRSVAAWTRALAVDLGVDPEVVDVQGLLDVARDAAHGVARPAAPLTTFLIGYAAGSGSGGLAEAMRRASVLADGWGDQGLTHEVDA